jgi:hypothetical protein
MATTYTHFSDRAQEVRPPDKGILSRTLLNDDRLKVVAFGFAQGEELSEHTVTFVYAASDEERNSAVALKELLERGKK